MEGDNRAIDLGIEKRGGERLELYTKEKCALLLAPLMSSSCKVYYVCNRISRVNDAKNKG
jgi:hypothetical protein